MASIVLMSVDADHSYKPFEHERYPFRNSLNAVVMHLFRDLPYAHISASHGLLALLSIPSIPHRCVTLLHGGDF